MTRLAWGSATDVGRVRKNNQDTLYTSDALFAVADGMGGHRGGEVASDVAIESLREQFTEPTTDALVRAVQLANDQVVGRANADPDLEGMGTTLCAVAVVQVEGADRLAIVNVGDSRVYQVDERKLTQLTRDDSEAEELIEMGLLSADAEIRPGYLHALTQAVGGRLEHVEIEVHTEVLKVSKPTRFLLCTDGLTDLVGRAAIEEITRLMRAPDVTAEALFGLAMDAGGLDNITLAIIDVEPVPRAPRGSARS